MPSEQTKQQALNILDNVQAINDHEMLVFGNYISEDVIDEKLAAQGAICGGRQACFVGSEWIAAGVKPVQVPTDDGEVYFELPNVGVSDRQEFLAHRHGLRLAHQALDRAARRRIARLDDPEIREELLASHFTTRGGAAHESLFEQGPPPYFVAKPSSVKLLRAWDTPEDEIKEIQARYEAARKTQQREVRRLIRSAKGVVEAA